VKELLEENGWDTSTKGPPPGQKALNINQRIVEKRWGGGAIKVRGEAKKERRLTDSLSYH